jgi:hypothetical protein
VPDCTLGTVAAFAAEKPKLAARPAAVADVARARTTRLFLSFDSALPTLEWASRGRPASSRCLG